MLVCTPQTSGFKSALTGPRIPRRLKPGGFTDDGDSRHFGLLSRLGGGDCRRWPDRGRRPGRTLHAQEARRQLPAKRRRVLPPRSGHHRRRSRLRRLLRQADHQVRATAGNLSCRWRRAATARSARPSPLWLQGKAARAAVDSQGARRHDTAGGTSSPITTSRTRPARSSPRPSTRRRSSRSTAWASGPPPASARAAATASS